MALKSTIFKAELSITDLDRHYYAELALTLARHPSETDERMMARLVAFALHADEALQFTRGLSSDDEPDLWQKNLSGEIELWIELGHPDEKRLRRACGRARQVVVYSYQKRSGLTWWEQIKGSAGRFGNLSVRMLPENAIAELAALAERSMRLQCMLQDGQLWISSGERNIEVTPELLKASS